MRKIVRGKEAPSSETLTQRGVLIASGTIAGESLVGVLLGILAYAGIAGLAGGSFLAGLFGLSPTWREVGLQVVSLTALLAVAAWVYVVATRRKQ